MWRRMGVIPRDHPGFNYQATKERAPVVEEIQGLIRHYKDGHVERLPAMPDVPSTWTPEHDVVSKDTIINQSTGIWVRLYVPMHQAHERQLPLLVYFHGGGFCVGSAAWSCYHEFLARLASRAGCIVVSVNYRLAPEHRLPTAYDDGFSAMKWLRQQAGRVGADEQSWWRAYCNFSQVFIGGDSAGAAIAHNVAARLGSCELPEQSLKPVCVRGVILIQPFFGGEARTVSEKSMVQPSRSALSLATSDCYWRLALPAGANRDHPWCNPLAKSSPKLEELRLPPVLVCISEMDILRDRDVEFCKALWRAGKSVEQVIFSGVGHAFQVLDKSRTAQARTNEMLSHIKAFINNR